MSTESVPPPVTDPADPGDGTFEPVAGVPTGRFGVKSSLLALILLAQGAVWAEFFPPIITLFPLRVRTIVPDDYTTALSIALTISAIIGLVMGPVSGAISDRSRSRFGRRRFWLAVFAVIGAVGNVIVGFADDMTLFTVGACIGQVGFASTTSIMFALIPEHVPPAGRGKVGALWGVTTAISTIVGIGVSAGLASSPGIAWIVLSVLGLGSVLLLCAFLPDAPFAGERSELSPVTIVKSFWISPRRYPDFGWAWLSRFTLYMGFAGVTTYQVFYLSDQIGVGTAEQATQIAGVGTVVQVLFTMVGAVVGGTLSDRTGRRKPFVMGAALIGLGALLCFTFATALPVYFVGAALSGVAQGCYASVDVPLVTALLPRGIADAGKDLGVVNIANYLPNTIAPAIAPLLLSISLFAVVHADSGRNYTMLFLGSAVFALISALAVLMVKSVR